MEKIMSGKIETLSRLASEYAESRMHLTGWSYTTEYNKKFAELIVKECLEACSRANEIRHFVPPTQQQVALSCMDEIERTFSELKHEQTN